MTRSSMRFEGILKSWNDDRGFGFIAPAQGGEEIFVHVKAFAARAGRPQAGQRVNFEVERNADGRKRARAVETVRTVRARAPARPDQPAEWSWGALLAIPAFAVVYAAAALTWGVPLWIGILYAAASVLALFAYAFDKAAAQAGRWRTSEGALLLLGAVGGWPGALVAQQLLRHKSSKASFRSAFWLSVVANVAAFVLLATPLRARLLGF